MTFEELLLCGVIYRNPSSITRVVVAEFQRLLPTETVLVLSCIDRLRGLRLITVDADGNVGLTESGRQAAADANQRLQASMRFLLE